MQTVALRARRHVHHMYWHENKLGEQRPSAIGYVCPTGHSLVKTSGDRLEKMSPTFGKGWQKRWFVLTESGVLRFYKVTCIPAHAITIYAIAI